METIGSETPNIIQGGMGIAVSSWQLARTVALEDEIGVVSGTGIDTVMVRELQDGDPNDRIETMQSYPDQEFVEQIVNDYYIEGGKRETEPYARLPIHRFDPTIKSQKLLSLGAYTEVSLAKDGHDGKVGINFLAKLKRFNLPAMYGAMLAGVDKIFMGAGIPKEEAQQVSNLAKGKPAKLRLDPDTSQYETDEPFFYEMDPSELFDNPPELNRPDFYPIVASDVLAKILDHKLDDDLITGWIIEGPVAGGHNAPPRNKQTDEDGNPIYDEKDEVNLDRVRDLGYPFYLAGGYGTPERFRRALDRGASGIQVGSIFSLAKESGYPADVKKNILRSIRENEITIKTSGNASPTGFPFKVLEMEGTLAEYDVYEERNRICDLGYLQEPFLDGDGNLRGRCPSEPVDDYVRKGGDRAETEERQCLCNALLANIGLGQTQKWGREKPLYTAGDQFEDFPPELLEGSEYSAVDVIRYLYKDR
ncbi:MAG: nitronate monooxygenase [bacterium]